MSLGLSQTLSGIMKVLCSKQRAMNSFQQYLGFATLASTDSSVNGFPTATTSDRARVIAVLNTYGLHKLLVGFIVFPEESTHSTVLINSARNSCPMKINRHVTPCSYNMLPVQHKYTLYCVGWKQLNSFQPPVVFSQDVLQDRYLNC